MTPPPSTEGLIERLREFEVSDALGNGDFSVCMEAADYIEAASTPPTPGPPDDVLVAKLRGGAKRLREAGGMALTIEYFEEAADRIEALARFTQPKVRTERIA